MKYHILGTLKEIFRPGVKARFSPMLNRLCLSTRSVHVLRFINGHVWRVRRSGSVKNDISVLVRAVCVRSLCKFINDTEKRVLLVCENRYSHTKSGGM